MSDQSSPNQGYVRPEFKDKIHAIKHLREVTAALPIVVKSEINAFGTAIQIVQAQTIGLREAKDIVEAIMALPESLSADYRINALQRELDNERQLRMQWQKVAEEHWQVMEHLRRTLGIE